MKKRNVQQFWNKLWHGRLGRPYVLHVRTDRGSGPAVVLLHGIGSSGATWQPVVRKLPTELRVVALDLLGFGESVKPRDSWVRYDVRDHARAVVATLARCGIRGPMQLVGHSMGCFVAIEVANLRPDLVDSLLLYEPPFYVGLPKRNRYRLRLSAYFSLYRALIRQEPHTSTSRFQLTRRVLTRIYGFEITAATWLPFQRSMEHTILRQTALQDLKKLTSPVTIVYGKYDQVVINDKKKVFTGDIPNVTAMEVPALHGVSARAAKVLAGLIRANV